MSWTRFFRRAFWDRERARELESYLEAETDDNIARGMAAASARAAARRKLGNATLVREEIFRMNTIGWLETFGRDLRNGARLLRRNPGFAATAILSLALGIGANTAIFEIIDAVHLRSLPVARPEGLAEIALTRLSSAETRAGRSGNFSGRRPMFTTPQMDRIRERQQGFSEIVAWGANPFGFGAGGETRFIQGLYVSGNFFSALGVQPAIGRLFSDRDDVHGCGSAGAVLGYGLWQREYGGDPSVLGRSIRLDQHAFEVVGVAPGSFRGVEVGQNFDVAVPLCSETAIDDEASGRNGPGHWWLGAMGRLKPGWSMGAASAQLAAISPGVFSETIAPGWLPEIVKAYRALTIEAVPARTGISPGIREDYDTPLWILLGTTAFILLIACANIANLLLARASVREREIAVRLAIGASRLQVIAQLLAESLLLASLGAVVALGTARLLSQALVQLLKMKTPKMIAIDLALDPSWHVWAFTIAVTAATCLLFGLVPAMRATAMQPSEAMKSGGRTLTDSRRRFDLRRLLVVAQVALGLVLVVGAVLFVRTFRNLATADPGFDSARLWDVLIDVEHAGVQPVQGQAFISDLVGRMRAVPGVESASIVQNVPLAGNSSQGGVVLDGQRINPSLYLNRVGDGYFSTMRTAILAGRDFVPADNPAAPRVAIVNESFAREFLNGQNPVGHRIQRQVAPGQAQPVYEIVGFVKDSKYSSLRESFQPIVFFPYAQGRPSSYFDLMVRAAEPAGPVVAAMRKRIAEINPGLRTFTWALDDEISDSLVRERLMAMLSGFFGILAACLATLGLYGVISYVVARRTNEIGVRMALGASRGDVIAMIFREAGVLVLAGLVLGMAVSVGLSRVTATLLFGIQPGDPMALIFGAAMLAAVALVATYVPAARAARLEPTSALRHD